MSQGEKRTSAPRRPNWRRRALIGTAGAFCAIAGLKLSFPFLSARSAAAGEPGRSVSGTAVEARRVPASPSYTSLKQLMEKGLSEPFGELSVYTFHGGGITEDSLPGITRAAAALSIAAAELPALVKRNFDTDEKTFFQDLATAFGSDAALLKEAAEKPDAEAVTRLLNRIDATCQSCHTRLAPHLIEKK